MPDTTTVEPTRTSPDATLATGTAAEVAVAGLPAMGSTAQVTVVGGPPDLMDHARWRLGVLESRWSRFLEESEISRLRRFGGAPTMVSADTFRAVRLATEGHRRTGGLFDPTLAPEIERLGYDRDRRGLWPPTEHDPTARASAEVAAGERATHAAPARGGAPRTTVDGIVLDARARTVRVPAGVGLDLGGLGKGLAADIVVAELLESGARGACVNVGGDLRVAGDAPHPGGWSVAVDVYGRAEQPTAPPEGAPVLRLAAGGVATSSRRHRRWSHGGREVHHLLDPSDGEPVGPGLATVVVAAANAGQAEILSTAALVAGPEGAARVIAGGGATGLLVDDEGRCRPLPGWEELAR